MRGELAFMLLTSVKGLLLILAIRGQPIHQKVEIDKVRIELGSVDAGEKGLAPNRNTAAAAHSGSVDHNWVERNNRMDAQRFGQSGHGAHHWHRADRIHDVNVTLMKNVLRDIRYKTFSAITAVVGANDNLSQALQLGLENNPFLRPAADNTDHRAAEGMESLSDRMNNRGANTSPD